MANKESNFKNMVLTLFMVTFIASGTLGFVYNLTKEPIAKAKKEKLRKAISNVIPNSEGADIHSPETYPIDGDSIRFFVAEKSGKVIGVAVETFTNEGFSGRIKLMAGFDPQGAINKIVVLEHKETPGLGDKIQHDKSDFAEQFEGKNPEDYSLKVGKDGGDVDAITASTITSRAYCDAVKRAYKALKEGGKI
jgi:electron transport complex protein RnfG